MRAVSHTRVSICRLPSGLSRVFLFINFTRGSTKIKGLLSTPPPRAQNEPSSFGWNHPYLKCSPKPPTPQLAAPPRSHPWASNAAPSPSLAAAFAQTLPFSFPFLFPFPFPFPPPKPCWAMGPAPTQKQREQRLRLDGTGISGFLAAGALLGNAQRCPELSLSTSKPQNTGHRERNLFLDGNAVKSEQLRSKTGLPSTNSKPPPFLHSAAEAKRRDASALNGLCGPQSWDEV